MASRPALFLPFMLLAAIASAQQRGNPNGPAVLGPGTAPAEILRKSIAQGAFGNLDVKEVPGTVRLVIDGTLIDGSDNVLLQPPGKAVELRASLEAGDTTETLTAPPDTGILRQTEYAEILWEGDTADRLAAGAQDTATWTSGSTDGRASRITASMAQLHITQTALAMASPADKTPARLLHGRASVMLLPGVTFDRNGDGTLQGVNVGIYPDEKGASAPNSVKENAQLYQVPTAFYRLDATTASARATEFLTLGQLNPSPLPEETAKVRFVALSPRLLKFLPALFATLEKNGLDPARLTVVRGFVSPTERLRLERAGVRLAAFTRHQYGDALVAVYRDPKEPAPRMADVDGDGTVTIKDADKLAESVKQTMDALGMYGGLGVIGHFDDKGTAKGSPCVHLDLRGFYAPFREE